MPSVAYVRRATFIIAALLCLPASLPAIASPKAEVTGSLVLNGVEAKITHVRAKQVPVDDKGTMGYAVFLSARPAEGSFVSCWDGYPKELGNFLRLKFTAKGELLVYEIGNTGAKVSRGVFGGVMEIKPVAFAVRGDQLAAHVRTTSEQSFSDDRFTVDLTFEVPIEAK